MAKVIGISKDSPLLGKILLEDDVRKFGDRLFEDVLDYIYADSMTEGTITVERNGVTFAIDFTKNQYETLGLEFDDSIELKPKECHNNCIFCFVRQLPKGLRDTLYVKDDDYRFSFISGSYITCTNLTEKDIERIITYKLSPLYISVHATDHEIRLKMLGIKKANNQLELLRRFTDNGIKFHTQIVLVSGINDGEVLLKSLNDLLNVGASSVAVVPVGLTTFREGLTDIKPLTKEQANSAIDLVEDFYKENKGFCYCADEMYQIAQRPFHDGEYYGEYDQIENGVGLVTQFLTELKVALAEAPKKHRKKSVGIFTGVSGYKIMEESKFLILAKYPKLNINIYPVINTFFGETVTVTGLVTATDIVKMYGEMKLKDKYLMIPSVMLKEFSTVFLDDKPLSYLTKTFNKKIVVSSPTGEDFLRKILYGDKK